MKKIFTLFAALAMVMSMFAETIPAGTKLYLVPNSNWNSANARFAAYFYGNGDGWASMTKVEGEENLYEVTSPAKDYTNVIFCRMNPGTSENNWANKWNQTSDLTYNGQNCYTITEGSWGEGTWSTYTLQAPVYKDITITVNIPYQMAAHTPKIYWWGADGVEDAVWDEAPEMVLPENAWSTTKYEYTFEQIDSVRGINYIIILDGVQTKDLIAHKDTAVTFKNCMPVVKVMGINDEWAGVATTVSNDCKTASVVLPMEANQTVEFKLTVDGTWIGNAAITADNNVATLTDGGNATIATTVAGGYTFTYSYITKELTVVYPYVGTLDLGEVSAEFDTWNTTLTDDEDNYVYIYNVNDEGERYYGDEIEVEAVLNHNGGTIEVSGKGSWTLEEDGSMTLNAPNLTDANNTVSYTVTATCPAPTEYTISATGQYDVEEGMWGPSWTYQGATEDETTVQIDIYSTFRGQTIDVYVGDAQASATTYEVEEDDDAVQTLTLTATSSNGDIYHITFVATPLPITPLVITNATAEATGYSIVLTATWEEQTLLCEIFGYEEGVEEYENVYIYSEDYSMEWGSNGLVALVVDDETYTLTGVFKDYATGTKYHVTLTTDDEVAAPAEEITCNNLETGEDEGYLMVFGYTDDWSVMVDLKIWNYTEYGYYEDVTGYYIDAEGSEYEVTGTGELYYDEDLETEVFEGVLSDGTNTYLVTLLNEAAAPVDPWIVEVTDATFTVDENDYLWITCTWNDGELNHELEIELAEGLMYGKQYAEAYMLIDGGIMQGGLMATGTPTITKEGNIATLTGTFTSTFTSDVYEVTISGVAPADPATALDNVTTTVAPVKTIKNHQLIININNVEYNAAGAVVK